MSCSNKISIKEINCQNNIIRSEYRFEGIKVYKNDIFFGEIIYSDDKIIQVKCKNKNRYMQGQIFTMKIVVS